MYGAIVRCQTTNKPNSRVSPEKLLNMAFGALSDVPELLIKYIISSWEGFSKNSGSGKVLTMEKTCLCCSKSTTEDLLLLRGVVFGEDHKHHFEIPCCKRHVKSLACFLFKSGQVTFCLCQFPHGWHQFRGRGWESFLTEEVHDLEGSSTLATYPLFDPRKFIVI